MYQQSEQTGTMEVGTESIRRSAPQALVAKSEPRKQPKTVYRYQRRVLPLEGGRVLLRLNEAPRIALDPTSMECEVIGWDVKMPAHQAENLDQAMARRFLDLFSKSDAGTLDEREQQIWLSVLDQVDGRAFSIDRASPHYLEGTLVRRSPVCHVEWNDGHREKIDQHVAVALSSLNPGDSFGAYVKLGVENKILSIERLYII